MDEINLNPDGTIDFTFQGVKYHLRAPYMEELFTLWTQSDVLAADAREKSRAYAEYVNAVATAETAAIEAGETPPVPDDPPFRQGELTIAIWRANGDWVRNAVGMLCSTPLPEGQAPSWFTDPKILGEWVAHWRSRPLGPGSEPTPDPSTT